MGSGSLVVVALVVVKSISEVVASVVAGFATDLVRGVVSEVVECDVISGSVFVVAGESGLDGVISATVVIISDWFCGGLERDSFVFESF